MEKQVIRIVLGGDEPHSHRADHTLLHKIASPTPDEKWIEVVETVPGEFVVVNNSLTDTDDDSTTKETHLAFSSWDEEIVKDLDVETDKSYASDEKTCFEMSLELLYEGVFMTPYHFNMDPHYTKERRIELLKRALSHVSMKAYCPGDL